MQTSGTTAGAGRPRLFFILGRGRSGTTLLSRILCRHPANEVAPEGFFVMNLRGRYGRGRFDERRVRAFCNDLVLENRMRTWQLDLQDVERRLLEALPRLDFATACAEVYASYAEVRAARQVQTAGGGPQRPAWVGDKNPHYALFAQRLSQIFPDARFVHIVRDPRDNVLSYQHVPFDVSDLPTLAARWRRYNATILDVSRRIPGRFHHLRYEDLLTTPEAALRDLCRFLGQDFDPAMLRFHEAVEAEHGGFYGAGSPWFDKLSRPLDAGQADKWRAALSDAQVATIESICAPLMERFGYALGSSAAERSVLQPRALAGRVLGRATVDAERLVFGAVPAGLRSWALNTYRSRTGRI